MRNVERIDGASYTPTARILLQNIDVRAEIISKKRVDSQKNTERRQCAPHLNDDAFFVDSILGRQVVLGFFDEIAFDSPRFIAEGVCDEREDSLRSFASESLAQGMYAFFSTVSDNRIGGDESDRFVVVVEIAERGIVDFGFFERLNREHELFFAFGIADVFWTDRIEQFDDKFDEFFVRNEVG